VRIAQNVLFFKGADNDRLPMGTSFLSHHERGANEKNHENLKG